MSLVWIIYLVGISASLSIFIFLIFIGLFIATVVFTAMAYADHYGPDENLKLISKKMAVACLIVGFINNFFPSRDTAYQMLAAYGIEEVIANQKANELAGKSVQIIEKAMDEYLKQSESKEERNGTK